MGTHYKVSGSSLLYSKYILNWHAVTLPVLPACSVRLLLKDPKNL